MQGENAAFAVLLLLDFCLFRSSVFVSVTIAMAFYCPNAPTFLMMMMMMTTFAFLALPTLATTPFFPAPFRRPLARASRWLRQSEDPVIDQ